MRITSVAEFADVPIPGEAILPDATTTAVQEIAWLRPAFADAAGNILLRIQALVVESQGRTIVVDTCFGNDKERTNPICHRLSTTFLGDFVAAGFDPGAVDAVACTHLHADHVGWNTILLEGRWVPTFPNARYYFSRADVEYWSTSPSEEGDLLGDSVTPVIDAGLAELVDAPLGITSEVSLISTPGHSPGHMSVRIESNGSTAVITGDVMHHPVQCARPSWGSSFDEDAAAAEKTRRAFLEEYAGTDVLVIGTHFATPGAGHITRDGDAYRLS